MDKFIFDKKKGFADKGRARYEEQCMNPEPKGFNPHPYPYHHILELEISDITNLGVGIGRDNDWVIQVPFCWPGEKSKGENLSKPLQLLTGRFDRNPSSIT